MSHVIKGPEIAEDGRAVGAREDTIVTPLELLATLDGYDGSEETDEKIVDQVVTLVNHSPDSVGKWAERFDTPITDFIQTCHEQRPVTKEFREKVGRYFEQYQPKG